MKTNRETKGFTVQALTLGVSLLAAISCRHAIPEMSELAPRYSMYPPENLYLVPVILVGRVKQNCRPIGKIHSSRWDGSPEQQWQVDVKVEHVLQGEVTSADVSIYYFVYRGNLGTSDYGLTDLNAGAYYMFFLQKDNGNLRTTCDGGHNCVPEVMTGAHPNYRRGDSPTINDAIFDILATRGTGITDKQMVTALHFVGDWGNKAWMRALERLVKTESPAVVEEACRSLQWTPEANLCAPRLR